MPVIKMNQKFNNVYTSMKEDMGAPAELTLPPECFIEMEGKFIEHRENDFLKMSFPVQRKYCNPAGNLLGGMMSAFFDNTFGPFSYMTAKKPTTSLDLNVTFIRSISPEEKEVIIEATIVKLTKTFIIFEGKAYNPDNDLLATSTSRMMILGK
jgi:uncharacterized protein (TIGR00369 family)